MLAQGSFGDKPAKEPEQLAGQRQVSRKRLVLMCPWHKFHLGSEQ